MKGDTGMNNKSLNIHAILAYITWIGWLFAFFTRNKADRFAALHLNQALIINVLASISGILTIVPLLGSLAYRIVNLAVFVLWCIGIYRAFTGNDEPLPLIGDFRLF